MMMRFVLTGGLLILPLSVSGKDALSIKHPLSDEDISSALALGNDLTEKLPRLFLGAAGSDFSSMRDDSNRNNNFMQQQPSVRTSGFGVEVYTPYSWLAKLVRDAAKRGKKMLPLHVNEQLRRPVLRVMCHADVPQRGREGTYGTPVDNVVLLPSDKKLDKEVLPTHTMRIPDKYATPGGGSVDIGPLLASFDLADVVSLSSLHKKGEFYVSIVATDGKTKKFKVKSKHFKNLP